MENTNADSTLCEKCQERPGKAAHFYYAPIVRKTRTRKREITEYGKIIRSDPVFICFECAKDDYLTDIWVHIGLAVLIGAVGLYIFNQGSCGAILGGIMALLGAAGILVSFYDMSRVSNLQQEDESHNKLNHSRASVAIKVKRPSLDPHGAYGFWPTHPKGAQAEAQAKAIQELLQKQLSKTDNLAEAVAAIVDANPNEIARYKAGEKDALEALIAQVRQNVSGETSSQAVKDLLKQYLDNEAEA